MSPTYNIRQRDFSDVKARLNSVGWFMPPYVSVGFLEMVALRVANGGGTFTQSDLEEMLTLLYGPERLASMVLNRYPSVPVIALYAETTAEAVCAHLAGLHHVAVGGLIPVVEGLGGGLPTSGVLNIVGRSKKYFEV